MTRAWGVRQGKYSSAGLVVAGDNNLLLLHGQRHVLQGRVVVLKDAGVETVLFGVTRTGLAIAQGRGRSGKQTHVVLEDTNDTVLAGGRGCARAASAGWRPGADEQSGGQWRWWCARESSWSEGRVPWQSRSAGVESSLCREEGAVCGHRVSAWCSCSAAKLHGMVRMRVRVRGMPAPGVSCQGKPFGVRPSQLQLQLVAVATWAIYLWKALVEGVFWDTARPAKQSASCARSKSSSAPLRHGRLHHAGWRCCCCCCCCLIPSRPSARPRPPSLFPCPILSYPILSHPISLPYHRYHCHLLHHLPASHGTCRPATHDALDAPPITPLHDTVLSSTITCHVEYDHLAAYNTRPAPGPRPPKAVHQH